jgi:hypothetical protein
MRSMPVDTIGDEDILALLAGTVHFRSKISPKRAAQVVNFGDNSAAGRCKREMKRL